MTVYIFWAIWWVYDSYLLSVSEDCSNRVGNIFEANCKILVSFVVNLIICTDWKDFLVKNFESDCKMLPICANFKFHGVQSSFFTLP